MIYCIHLGLWVLFYYSSTNTSLFLTFNTHKLTVLASNNQCKFSLFLSFNPSIINPNDQLILLLKHNFNQESCIQSRIQPMKRLSLTPNKTTQEKNSTLDSVSASQLLKALHTLESINIIQEQIDDDLNISFSQKDTFSQDGQTDKESFNKSKTIPNMPLNSRNKTTKNQMKQANHHSALKNKPKQQPNQTDQCMQSNSKTGKMNFQFYMSKKQHTAMGLLKNRSKSPRPSQVQQSKALGNKSFEKNLSSKTKKLKQNMTPRGKDTNNGNNKTIGTGNKADNRHNNSVSPLTERSMNVLNKETRLKTQANESSCYQKRHTKTNSNLVPSNKEDQFNKTNISSSITAYKQCSKPVKSTIQAQLLLPISTTHKKPRQSTNPLHSLSIHQRNKQYLRQKNQRLAKLCQQMQEKKREQQKQCTFKPKILNDNSNIKPKYNDLRVSRELMDRGHKKCKQGKENISEQESVGEWADECGAKTMRGDAKYLKPGKDGQNKKSIVNNDDFGSRVNEDSVSLDEQRSTVTAVKPKYKNSKFNILLDLIH